MQKSVILTSRRAAVATLAVAAATLAAPGLASAADAYPNKSLTIVVPFSAGGTTDILARIVGKSLGDELGQAVIIDNRAGAGGNIGAQVASRAKADGYTLFMGTVGTHAINETLYKKLPFKPLGDFAPLTRVAMVPNILVAHPSQPFKTVKEMIAYAQKNPGRLTYGSPGNGSSPHVSGELFESLTKTELLHVPYKGSAPAMNDLLANQVNIMFDNLPSAMQHVKAGKLVPIAVTSAQRYPELPKVPTIAEAGVPGYEATSWFGLFTNRAVPAPIVAQLNAAIVKVLAKPEVVAQMKEQGAIAHPETPAAFDAFIKAETAKWGKVVRDSGATAD
ncbi:LacI family transcriptional regulator [Comamonas serinivorans]|uniref:LacI family transcriptional regulator n=1 Tax=Comamonas serinivorans TaxID=1082851 RepID=A0A1Y0ELS6_9BURK|nr:tripartite tricarboxylate transporter substrate binding protein [Comamonas serinivorans]ARU04242.1 LacI family transcriptional regulator [Comamonas serinivorans]